MAFDYIKNKLVSFPMFGFPDTSRPYILYCDANYNSVGASVLRPCEEECLLNNGRIEKSIYFLSHKWNDTQQKWSTIEKEAFAICYAFQKLDFYLHKSEFFYIHRPQTF